MITTDQSELEVFEPFQTPFTNPQIRYDSEAADGPESSLARAKSQPPAPQFTLPKVVFLSTLALGAPAILLTSAPGESSSLDTVQYVLARSPIRSLTINEARLLALQAHIDAEKLIREDRCREARAYMDLSPETDG